MNENETNQPVDEAELEKIGEAGIKGASVALSILGSAMSEIAKSVDITNGLSAIMQDFSKHVRSAVAEIFSASYFENLRQQLSDSLIEECEAAGSMGWCFHNIDGLGDELSFVFFRNGKNYIDNGEATIADIDSYVTKQFSKEIIADIALKTEKLLSPEDTVKFQKAMIDFRSRRYYDSANLLVGLIDAQNIKEVLFHGNPGDNISQGLQVFAVAYGNKFSSKLDMSSMKPKSKKREDELSDFVETNKDKGREATTLIKEHIALIYSMFAIFHNSDWRDYPHDKPAIINRHWLAHGMYNYNDVKKSDCIKLLFILNQVASLYQ